MSKFSIEDAKILVAHLEPIAKGKVLEPSTNTIVTHLSLEDLGDDKFSIIAHGNVYQGAIYPRKRLEKLLQQWSMETMEEFLYRLKS